MCTCHNAGFVLVWLISLLKHRKKHYRFHWLLDTMTFIVSSFLVYFNDINTLSNRPTETAYLFLTDSDHLCEIFSTIISSPEPKAQR